MKYKIWDYKNQCWYKPTYQADKGQLEEIFMTQSGELCMRKMINGEEKFFHESILTYEVKNESGEELRPRFKAFMYTGRKDSNGNKLYEGDCLTDSELPDVYEIKFGIHSISDGIYDEFTGFYMVNKTTDKASPLFATEEMELVVDNESK